jgi:Uma2 family endonuclease
MPVQTVISSKLAEFDNLPEGPPYYELIRNQIIEMPPPTTFHQEISINISSFIFTWVKARQLGKVFCAPTEVCLPPETVVLPDLLFVSNERLSIITEKRIEGAPDWVCEILSPSTRKNDLTVKKELYQAHGVKEYWIVDPDISTVDVFLNHDGQFVLHSTAREQMSIRSLLFPDLELYPQQLFA